MNEWRSTVTSAWQGRLLKRYITGPMGISPSLYARIKFSGSVTVNGLPARADQILREGDSIRLTLEEKPAYLPRPAAGQAPILWQDEHFFVLNKPAPMACQSSRNKGDDTLENLLFYSLGCPESFVYRPVNRLDAGTSGLMIAARSPAAHGQLQKLLHTPGFRREYWGITLGEPPSPAGCINAPIGRAEGVRRRVSAQGRPASTHYRVLASNGETALVHFQLETGRTHQIRVHMAHGGSPLLGDWLYGQEDPRLPGRFALHCFRLTLVHPFTGQTLRLAAPPPPELARLIKGGCPHA